MAEHSGLMQKAEVGTQAIGGYVLAGGNSSRMGQDKALLELAGRPLIYHAMAKLKQVCAEVHILGERPEFEVYAPLVRDLHPGCGPMAGMEAGLSHSTFDWNLFLAVDMPFLPSESIAGWVVSWLREGERRGCGPWVCLLTVNERPQPGFCLLHREVRPFLTNALDRGDYKLMPTLMRARQKLAARHGFPPQAIPGDAAISVSEDVHVRGFRDPWPSLTDVSNAATPLWFANLNTPEDFAVAAQHLSALDP